MKVTIDNLSDSILEFMMLEKEEKKLSEIDCLSLYNELQSRSLSEDGKWFQVCKCLLKGYSYPVIKQHISKCNKLFLRNFEEIKDKVLTLMKKDSKKLVTESGEISNACENEQDRSYLQL